MLLVAGIMGLSGKERGMGMPSRMNQRKERARRRLEKAIS